MASNKYETMVSYYNTNKLTGNELKQAEQNARTQEEIILEMFQNKNELSASDIYKRYPKTNLFGPPITSIRRAMTNLKNAGHIIKTDKLVIGMYGRPEHIYKLNK